MPPPPPPLQSSALLADLVPSDDELHSICRELGLFAPPDPAGCAAPPAPGCAVAASPPHTSSAASNASATSSHVTSSALAAAAPPGMPAHSPAPPLMRQQLSQGAMLGQQPQQHAWPAATAAVALSGAPQLWQVPAWRAASEDQPTLGAPSYCGNASGSMAPAQSGAACPATQLAMAPVAGVHSAQALPWMQPQGLQATPHPTLHAAGHHQLRGAAAAPPPLALAPALPGGAADAGWLMAGLAAAGWPCQACDASCLPAPGGGVAAGQHMMHLPQQQLPMMYP